MPFSSVSAVLMFTTVPLVTAFSTVPCTGVDMLPSVDKRSVKFLFNTFSVLMFFGEKLAPANSVPDSSLNLTVKPSNNDSPTKSKLSPFNESALGTAVTLRVVSANETVAVSVITFNAV